MNVEDGTVVYLVGDHSEEDALGTPSAENPTKSRRVSGYFCYAEDPFVAGPGDLEDYHVIISSPFEKTLRGRETGFNIALAKLHNGYFMYWGTWCSPAPGHQISKLLLEDIPSLALLGLRGKEAVKAVEDGKKLPTSVLEGAWVIRGDRLVEPADEKELPRRCIGEAERGFFPSPGAYGKVRCVSHVLEDEKGTTDI